MLEDIKIWSKKQQMIIDMKDDYVAVVMHQSQGATTALVKSICDYLKQNEAATCYVYFRSHEEMKELKAGVLVNYEGDLDIDRLRFVKSPDEVEVDLFSRFYAEVISSKEADKFDDFYAQIHDRITDGICLITKIIDEDEDKQ